MTATRLLVLQVFVLLGFTSIFLLPKVSGTSPRGVDLELPEFIGEWYGVDVPVSERELQVLAEDTEFARKLYSNGRGDQVFVSVVLSGSDPDNSIHRPERCLPAQGWSVADSRAASIPLTTARGGNLGVTRLYNVRTVPLHEGETATVHSINYYWFVGAENVTPSHFERTYIDIRDRLLKGQNQRWAYVTIAATITQNLARFGRDEKETDEMLQQFIADLYPQISKV